MPPRWAPYAYRSRGWSFSRPPGMRNARGTQQGAKRTIPSPSRNASRIRFDMVIPQELPRQFQRFFASVNPALQLGVFHRVQHPAELRPRLVPGGDEIISLDEPDRPQFFGGRLFESRFGEVVTLEIAVAARAVQTM